MTTTDERLIERALARDVEAERALVQRLTPSIQRAISATLTRRGRRRRADVLDLTQEVFRVLLEEDGRVLRDWAPERGASLEGFVGLVAERFVIGWARSGRRSGHREDPAATSDLSALNTPVPSPESALARRQRLAMVLVAVRQRSTDKGFAMFVRLFVEERSVSWFAEHEGMNEAAVYAWRSRLKRLARKVDAEIASREDPREGARKQPPPAEGKAHLRRRDRAVPPTRMRTRANGVAASGPPTAVQPLAATWPP